VCDRSGALVAYVKRGNVVVQDLKSGVAKALTKGANETRSFGLAEFIAEEELSRHDGFWWSPDSSALLVLEEQGAERFFGEPMLDIDDLMQTGPGGRGVINILVADRLLQAPRLYGSFLLWMLSELFGRLPEVGDRDKPKIVFFFDEAHLLFDEAPRALQDNIEQVVRLIRSKGVGVYFVTQNPLDIPDRVLGQLGNRVQHALRAYTPRDQKAVRTAASTMRANPAFDVERAITELAVGEALVSMLDEKGRPSIVERAWICPPASRLGPIDEAERGQLMRKSVVAGIYDRVADRESAYEMLRDRAVAEEAQRAHTGAEQPPRSPGAPGARRESAVEALGKSVARSVGSTIGREIVRGILGTILGRGRR
jgi:DNA helicase HerA-like ATPase